MIDLETVIVYLNRQTNDIWSKMGDNFNVETMVKFVLDRDRVSVQYDIEWHVPFKFTYWD